MNFKQKYNRIEFNNFLYNFLPNDFNFSNKDILIDTRRYKAIKKAEILGICKSLDNLHIIECLHNKNNDPRISITTDAFKIMADHRIRKALIIFYNEDSNNYRLSFLKISINLDENNKITKKFSDAKRLSFYLGENAKVRTPEIQLIDKGKVQSIEDLESRFSVEVVNKLFYLEIAKLFDKFVYSKDLEIKFPTENELIRKNFVVRLLGRIIFCWFLKQKKGERGQLIPDTILSSGAVSKDYYHKIIEPLFFEILNNQKSERKIRGEEFDKVPYLNGGLFQPQSEDYYALNQNTFVSNFQEQLKIDDNWFLELFELLEDYNFTIDENTSQDQELSIDPEMLGRIFENLLAELNERKKTGSFYTPREIVDYMVDSSLQAYFSNNSDIDKLKINSLLSYDLEDDTQNPISANEKIKLLELIDALKILDPACGSGAFPMGILQKLIFITKQLDPDGSLWLNIKLKSVHELYRNKIIEEFKNKPLEYIRKLDIIKNSIHGIDIQPIAVDVSRLRCFLTLIVEAKVDDNNSNNNRGLEALPNLDFKFVCADTLTPSPDRLEYGSSELFSENDYNSNDSFQSDFINSVDIYFGSSGNLKNTAKDTIYKLIIQKIKEKMDKILNSKIYLKTEKRSDFNKEYEKKNKNKIEMQTKLTNLWESYLNIFNNSAVKFFDTKYFFPSVRNGFDIVIGNPPYISAVDSSKTNLINRDDLRETFPLLSGSFDIYLPFLLKGENLLSKNGIYIWIIPNKFLISKYSEKVLNYLKSISRVDIISVSTTKVFESASVYPIIVRGNKGLKSDFTILEAKSLEDLQKGKFSERKDFLKNNLMLKDEKIKVASGTTGFQAQQIIKYITEENINNSIPFIVSGSVNPYSINYSNVRYMGKVYKKPYISKGKDISDSKWTFWNKPKIIIAGMTKRIEAVYCEKPVALGVGIYAIYDFGKYNPYYLLGLLNSCYYSYYLKNNFIDKHLSGGYIAINKSTIEKLPIPAEDNAITLRIINYVNQIINLVQSDQSSNLNKIKSIEHQIDILVFDLFKISEEERASISRDSIQNKTIY